MSWWEVASECETRIVYADMQDEALAKLDGAVSARYVAGDHEGPIPFNMRIPKQA